MADEMASNGQQDVFGRLDQLSIRGGSKGYLTTSDDGLHATIQWLQGGIEFIIRGPDIGPVQAVVIANEI
jgi:hypothetical protein